VSRTSLARVPALEAELFERLRRDDTVDGLTPERAAELLAEKRAKTA